MINIKDKIIQLPVQEKYRIIVISDIHGGYHLYKKLIDKIKIKESDFIIILGDFIEKGPNNIKTLEAMMEISKRKNNMVVSGNCEMFISYLMNDLNNAHKMGMYLKNKKHKSIIDEWLNKLKINKFKLNMNKIHCLINENFKEELNFIKELPIGVETDKFIFVHGGIDKINDWKKSSLKTLISCEEFYKKGHNDEKTVVVGHWPASNYKSLSASGDIIWDKEKKIISIDGGYAVKLKGQLNGLIIDKDSSGLKINNTSVDDFSQYIVTKKQYGSKKPSIKIGWPHNKLNIIKKNKEFSLCMKLNDKNPIWVKNELIESDGNEFVCNQDYLCYFHAVDKGDIVKVVNSYGNYVFAKYKNEYGWIKKNRVIPMDRDR